MFFYTYIAKVIRQGPGRDDIGEPDRIFNNTVIIEEIAVSLQPFRTPQHKVPAAGSSTMERFKIFCDLPYDKNGFPIELKMGDVFVIDGDDYHTVSIVPIEKLFLSIFADKGEFDRFG